MNNLFSALLPALFQAVLAMSLTAAAAAAAVLVIRAVMKALHVPRAIVFLLWAVVLFRMVCPVSFSSSWSLLSLLPAAEQQTAVLSADREALSPASPAPISRATTTWAAWLIAEPNI